jgi:TPR repeat protein
LGPVDDSAPDSDASKARVHAGQAFALGSGRAAFDLGNWAYRGMGEPQDYRRAYNFLVIADERGWADAPFLIGLMHERGEGVPVTPIEAAYFFRKAALAGDRAAARRLAAMYLDGNSLALDFGRAAYWISAGTFQMAKRHRW